MPYLKSLFVLFVLGCASLEAAPNIVIIMADDLGYGDLGCYGNQKNKTPHLDQLAAEGMLLKDFHSNGSMCSPTRAAMLTGLYQQRLGIESALPLDVVGMPHQARTLAEQLKQQGYRTAIMGKWHLGDRPESNPVHHGFDVFKGHLSGATDYRSHIDRGGSYDWYHNEKVEQHTEYNTTRITNDSVEFIQENSKKPFFLYVSHSAIHFPWMSPADAAYRKEGKQYFKNLSKLGPRGVDEDVSKVVQAMIESVDQSTGQIIASLKTAGVADNTLVFFTSDNGGYRNYSGTHEGQISDNGIYRGQKTDAYEGGHRVPAIAWWPGKIAAGVQTNETVLSMDLMPTILNMVEASSALPSDGIDIASLLFQQEKLPKRDLFFWRMGYTAAVRSGDWKLVRARYKPIQLFNLKDNPQETVDLSAEHSDMVERFKQALAKWEQDVDGSYAELMQKSAKSN